MGNRTYIVYDGRASSGEREDIDRALVLTVGDSLEEVMEHKDSYADFIVYSYDNTGEYLSDERREYPNVDSSI